MTPIAMCDDQTTSSFSVNYEKDVGKQDCRRSLLDGHRVSFHTSHQVFEFDKLETESHPECWYSREEYEMIKARNSLIVKMFKVGKFSEGDEHSFRGLEHKLKEGFKKRRENKFNGLNAVLDEQDRQFNHGILNPDGISEVYRRVTMNSRETAFVIALRDAEGSYSYRSPEQVGYISDLSINCEDDTTVASDASSRRYNLKSLFQGINLKRKEDHKMLRRTSV